MQEEAALHLNQKCNHVYLLIVSHIYAFYSTKMQIHLA